MFWSPNRSTGRIQRTASIVLFPVNTLEGDNPRHCEGRRSPSHVPLAPAIWFACDLPRTRGGLDPFWTAGDPLERKRLTLDRWWPAIEIRDRINPFRRAPFSFRATSGDD